MKRLVRAMMMNHRGAGGGSLPGCAQPACGPVVVRAEVEAAPGSAKPGGFAGPGNLSAGVSRGGAGKSRPQCLGREARACWRAVQIAS